MTAKPRLRLTTPVTRIRNLPTIEADPELLSAPEHFDVLWHVLIDCATLGLDPSATHYVSALPWCRVENVRLERPGRHFGEDLYNAVLDEMALDEWHMGIADDSLPTPGVFRALREEIDLGAEVVMFPMDIGTYQCRAAIEAVRAGNVSGGQVFYRRDVVGDLRWEGGDACLDGIFLQKLRERTEGRVRWRFRSSPMLRHNQLPR